MGICAVTTSTGKYHFGNGTDARDSAAGTIVFDGNMRVKGPDHSGNDVKARNFLGEARNSFGNTRTIASFHSGNGTKTRASGQFTIASSAAALIARSFPKWNPRGSINVEAANSSTMNVTCIRAGVKDLSSANLIAKTMCVEACMANNPHFPDPTPTLAALGAARSALQMASAAALARGRAAVAIRWERHAELERLMVQLSKYVMATAPGDVEKQLSSGFTLRNAPLPIRHITAPQEVTTYRVDREGSVKLSWGKVHGARTYQVFCTCEDTQNEKAWQLATHSTRLRTEVQGLEPGRLYHFRVRAILAAGEGPFSQVITKRAA